MRKTVNKYLRIATVALILCFSLQEFLFARNAPALTVGFVKPEIGKKVSSDLDVAIQVRYADEIQSDSSADWLVVLYIDGVKERETTSIDEENKVTVTNLSPGRHILTVNVMRDKFHFAAANRIFNIPNSNENEKE